MTGGLIQEAQRLSGGALAVLRAQRYLYRATSLGSRVRLWGKPAISVSGKLYVGDRVRLVSTIAPLEIVVGPKGVLDIGEDVYINYGCSIGATLSVSIGAHTAIGQQAILMDNDFHQLDADKRHICPPSQPIVLEENVWLGARVIVLRGVRIGRNSVIGAGSVVTRDIPPDVIAAGVPAKVVRALNK